MLDNFNLVAVQEQHAQIDLRLEVAMADVGQLVVRQIQDAQIVVKVESEVDAKDVIPREIHIADSWI